MSKAIKFILAVAVIFFISFQQSFGQDEILFRKHVVSSGWNGLFYGIALDIIADLDGAAAVGVPVITAGTSALLPLLTNPSKTITSNSLVLTSHGKSIGWAHGMSLTTLVGGENAWKDNNYKISVGAGALSSIGLGILGNSLGKNQLWDEGQVALYRHYGWLMPFTGFSISAAFSDEPRIFGGSVLLFGAGGYFLADQVFKMNPYTRGDVRSTQVLSLLHGYFGYGILIDRGFDLDEFARTDWLFPAAGFLTGTVIGHLWLKNTQLTPQQGTYSGYAAAGGALVGLGIALLFESENFTPYYVVPYLTGMGAFAFAVERFRSHNRSVGCIPEMKKNNWDIALMPQNLFLNQQLIRHGTITPAGSFALQPAFSASLKF